MNSKFVLTAALFVAGCSMLSAQDWPQWRGANRDGKTTGFTAPQTWPANLVQKWNVPVGKGDATPALVGDKVYAFGRLDTDEVITCLEAASGKIVWQSRYPVDFVVRGPSAGHPGPRSSPVFVDGKLCTLGVCGILSCLDAAKGSVLWRKQSNEDFQGVPYKTDSSMSPIVVDGKCIVHIGRGNEGAIMAFDLQSGKFIWKCAGDGAANSSPVVMTVGGTKQLVTLTAKKIVGVSLADGKILWELPFEAAQGNNTTPVVDGATFYYTGQGKGLGAAKIALEGEKYSVTGLWTNIQLGARFTTPVLKDGMLYGNSGRLFCVDAATGESLWTEARSIGQMASIVDAGSVLTCMGMRGELVVYKAGVKNYTELASFKVASTETWPHPVISGNRIYVKDAESISLWMLP